MGKVKDLYSPTEAWNLFLGYSNNRRWSGCRVKTVCHYDAGKMEIVVAATVREIRRINQLLETLKKKEREKSK